VFLTSRLGDCLSAFLPWAKPQSEAFLSRSLGSRSPDRFSRISPRVPRFSKLRARFPTPNPHRMASATLPRPHRSPISPRKGTQTPSTTNALRRGILQAPHFNPDARNDPASMVLNRPLTESESAFVCALLLGFPNWRAYMSASGATCAKKSAENNAWRWLQRPAVQAELIRRRAALDERLAATRIEKRVTLANILRDPAQPALARIAAINVDNRMTGHDEPVKTPGEKSGGNFFTVDPMRDMRRAEKVLEAPKEAPAS
jgi:hypothetical protein